MVAKADSISKLAQYPVLKRSAQCTRTLSEQRCLSGFVLRDFVHLVLQASLALAEGALLLRNVNLYSKHALLNTALLFVLMQTISIAAY